MRLLLRAARRDFERHPTQALLALLGVALGVALGVSVDLANQTALSAFEQSAASLQPQATHELVGGSEGIPVDWIDRLERFPGVRSANPVVELVGTVADPRGEPVRLVGFDPLRARGFFAGLEPASRPEDPSLLERFLTQPAALAPAELAKRLGFRPGESLRLVVAGRNAELPILGTWAARSDPSRPLTATLLVDVATAQELWNRPDRVSRIELELEPGFDLELARELPFGLVLHRPADRAATLDRMTSAFRTNLRALSWLALVCGLFLLFQALHLTAVRRREELARFRALGATRRQLLLSGWIEIVALGSAGTGLGLALGWLLAQGLTRLVLRTIQDLYFTVAVGPPALEPEPLLRGVLAGLIGTAAAAALPTFQAAETDPRLALSRIGLEQMAAHWAPRAGGVGIALAAAGLGLVVAPGAGLGLTFAGLFGLLVGVGALVPWGFTVISRGLARLGGLPVWLRSTLRGVAASLSRTGPAAAALALASAVGVSVAVSIASLRSEVTGWLGQILPGDLYLSPPARPGSEALAAVRGALVEELSALAGVARVEPIRIVQLDRQGQVPLRLLGVGADSPNLRAQRLRAGSFETALAPFRAGRGVIVSEPLARREGLRLGQLWELPLPAGRRQFEVVGIHADFASDQGAVLLERTALEESFGAGPPSALAVFLSPGEDGRRAGLEVGRQAREAGLIVQTNRELRQESLRIFDRTFEVAATLRWLTLLVAALGVASGLAALELERGRELATLFALGVGPRGLRRLVLLEGAWLGLFSAVAALPAGALLAYGLLEGINRKSFGWTVPLELPAGPLWVSFASTLLAALVASLAPARAVSRMDAVPYLRAE